MTLAPSLKINYPYMYGFIWGPSIQFHSSTFLCLYQNNNILITVVLWYIKFNSLFIHFIVVQVQFSTFSHHHFSPPQPPPLPTLNPSFLWLCFLYACSLMTLPLLSPIIAPPPALWLLSVCSLFNVSGYILLACLFC